MKELLPTTQGEVESMLRENPDLVFTINAHADHFTITIKSPKFEYVLFTMRDVVRTFSNAGSAIKILHELGATDIRVCTKGMGKRK